MSPDELYDGRGAAAALSPFCAEVGVMPVDVETVEPALWAVDSQFLQQCRPEGFQQYASYPMPETYASLPNIVQERGLKQVRV